MIQEMKDGDFILRGKDNNILKITAKTENEKTENEKIIYDIEFYDSIESLKKTKKEEIDTSKEKQPIIFEQPENTTKVFKILTSDENLEIGTATSTWKERYEREGYKAAITEVLNNIDSDKIDYVKAILKSINEFRQAEEWEDFYNTQKMLQGSAKYQGKRIPNRFEPRVGFKQMYENETFKNILFANMIDKSLIKSTDTIDDAKEILFKASASVQKACDKAGLGTKFGRKFKGKDGAGHLMNSTRFAKLVETVGFDLDSFFQSKSVLV
jgi:hypothetical protein